MPVLVMYEQNTLIPQSGGSNLNTTNSTTGDGNGTYQLSGSSSSVAFHVSDDDLFLDDGSFPAPAGNEAGVRSTLTSDITLDGITWEAGDFVDLEFGGTGTNTTTGQSFTYYMISIDGQDPGETVTNVGIIFVPSDAVLPGQFFTINNSYSDNQSVSYDVLCFANGTMIDTPNGEVAVENLEVGGVVRTASGSDVQIRWIGKRTFSSVELSENPKLYPIKLAANALGENAPSRDLSLSPQHRVLVSDWRSELLFGLNDFFCPAKALVNGTSIVLDTSVEEITYYHIMLDDHDVLVANGQKCESFYVGEQSLKTLSTEAYEELLSIFPEIAKMSGTETKAACLKPYEVKALKAVA